MRHLVKTFVALAVLAATPASAAAAPALPGVPSDASLLFALESRAGALVPDARAGKGHFTLTLRGVERRATWFTDRPQRNAGRVGSAKLFGAWRELGFRASPPNAALVVDRAKSGRDTVAVELRLRSYLPRRRTARFAVRTLGALGNGLRHINRRIDRRLPRRFGSASLFIDNATYFSGEACPLGQPQLLSYNEGLDEPVAGMLPADGRTLSILNNSPLFQIVGAGFGGDGVKTFALPDMDAPPNLAWFICVAGVYPVADDLGDGCVPGEVDYWIYPGQTSDPDWLPADGRTIPVSQYPEYGQVAWTGQINLPLPDVPAPPGMQSLVCVQLDYDADEPPSPTLGQVDLFTGTPFLQGNFWMTAQGQQLSTYANQELFFLLTPDSPLPSRTFDLPALEAPSAGVEYYIATNGAFPLAD